MTERLYWDQARAIKREFRLRKGLEVVAELRFPSIWSDRAKGLILNGTMDIIQEGIIHQRYRVLNEVLGLEIATAKLLRQFWKVAEIELPSGRRYELTSKGTFHRVWTLYEVDAGGRKEFFALIETKGFLKEEGFINAPKDPSKDHDFLLLALLVWYLVLTIHMHEGAT